MTDVSQNIAMVTRRFWPLIGGAEMAMSNLACELARQGASPTVVTAKWQRSWPAEVSHREVKVVRLAQPSLRLWGTWRYMGALARWLRQRRRELDVVFVSMLKHDAYAAIGAMRGARVPVILRAGGSGPDGDINWQRTANFGRAIAARCKQADAFVVCSRQIEAELLEAGYPRSKVHYLPNGVAIPPPRSASGQIAARRALAETQAGLAIPDEAVLTVYTGRLDSAKGLGELVSAWQVVHRRDRQARLWLVGEGPYRSALEEKIEAAGLQGVTAMPGSFDDVDDVLAAADYFVLPSYSEGMSMALLEAMAAGLPVVATDIIGNRPLIEHGRQGLLVPPRQSDALAAALLHLMDDPPLAAHLGQSARELAQEQFSLTTTARRHLDLFARVSRERAHGSRPAPRDERSSRRA